MFEEPRDAAKHAELTQAEIAQLPTLLNRRCTVEALSTTPTKSVGYWQSWLPTIRINNGPGVKKVEWLQKRKLTAVEALSISSCVLLWRKNIVRSQDRWRRL
jgi:hypothetical protein